MKALDASGGNQPARKVLGITRRQLGILAGLAGAGAIGLACTQEFIESLAAQIRNRPVRREINSLAPTDKTVQSYPAAVPAMKALPQTDGRNWTRQAEIHNTMCRHASWLILPWHRAYLMHFEQICRELSGDADFALPYWNWTANRRVPAVFWDTSSPLYHDNRAVVSTSEAPLGIVGQGVVDNALAPTNFILFAGAQVGLNHPPTSGPGKGPLESGPHDGIHVWIGGTMRSFRSPLDPIFWLHHAHIDQLWVQWNLVRGNPNTNAGDWVSTEFTEFFDRQGNQATSNVALTTLAPLLSYRYDTQEAV